MSDDQQLSQSSTSTMGPGAAPALTSDQTAAAPAPDLAPNQDAVAELEALLARARENRGQTASPKEPEQPQSTEPTPEEIKAQQQVELAQMEQAAQVERAQLLEEQRRKLEGLKDTPEFQARQQQNNDDTQQKAANQAAQQGHVIRQITETKV